MEKQLMDKIRNHTTDDIDKDMIMARLKFKHMELRNILDKITDGLDNLSKFCEENEDEAKLLDIRLCFAYDDALVHRYNKDSTKNNGVPCLCALGAQDKIKVLLQTLQEAIDS